MLVLKILKYDNPQKLDFKERILKMWTCFGIKTLKHSNTNRQAYRVSQKKRTFRIIILQADTPARLLGACKPGLWAWMDCRTGDDSESAFFWDTLYIYVLTAILAVAVKRFSSSKKI